MGWGQEERGGRCLFFFLHVSTNNDDGEEKINLSLTLSNKICRLFLHQRQGKT